MKLPNAMLALLLASLLAIPLSAGAEVAKVIFAFGDVSVEAQDGRSRSVSRGDAIVSGDTLQTEKGRIQVRFKDGGSISLRPNTAFKVDDYRFEGKEDGSELAVFRLLRGGIRAITGTIGKRNKRNYRVETRTATIGIRGTSFLLLDCLAASCVTPDGKVLPDGVYSHTGDGTIYMETNVASVDLPFSAGGFSKSRDDFPVITTAPPPTTTSTIQGTTLAEEAVDEAGEDTETVQAFNVGVQTGEGGLSEIVAGDISPDQLGSPLTLIEFAEPGDVVIGAVTGGDTSQPVGRATPFVFVDGFALTDSLRTYRAANGVTAEFVGAISSNPSFVASADTRGSTSEIFVERFSNVTRTNEFAFVDPQFSEFDGVDITTYSGNESAFQVSGRPTDSIPSSGMATYNLAGTSNSATINSTLGTGVTSAQLTVNFTTASVDLFYQVDHVGTIYNAFHSAEPLLSFDGAVSSAYTFGANGGFAIGGFGACFSGCFSVVGGFLAGNASSILGNVPSASGFVYTIFETNPIQGGAALSLDPASVMPYP